jgi:hypothetical protein
VRSESGNGRFFFISYLYYLSTIKDIVSKGCDAYISATAHWHVRAKVHDLLKQMKTADGRPSVQTSGGQEGPSSAQARRSTAGFSHTKIRGQNIRIGWAASWCRVTWNPDSQRTARLAHRGRAYLR